MQTPEHLFCHCPYLRPARTLLLDRVGGPNWNLDFKSLVTKHTRIAMQWALTFIRMDPHLLHKGATVAAADSGPVQRQAEVERLIGSSHVIGLMS